MGMRYLGKVLRKLGKVVRSCVDNLCCGCPELEAECVCCHAGTHRDTMLIEFIFNPSPDPGLDCATIMPWIIPYAGLEFEIYATADPDSPYNRCYWKGYSGVSTQWVVLKMSGCGGLDPGNINLSIYTDASESTLVGTVINSNAFTGTCCDDMSRGGGSGQCLLATRIWPLATETGCCCNDVPDEIQVNLTINPYMYIPCTHGIEDYDGVDVLLPFDPNELWPCRFFGETGVNGQYMEVICTTCGNTPCKCYTGRIIKLWESEDTTDATTELYRWEGYYGESPGSCCTGWQWDGGFFPCVTHIDVTVP